MRKLATSLIMACLLFLACPASSLATQAASPEHQVVILMIDKLRIDDLSPQNTPFLWSLKDRGGIGLLNTLTGGDRTTKNGCATISAGKLAVGSNKADQNFMAAELVNGEKAKDLFTRNTGLNPHMDNVLVSSIAVIKKNNEALNLGIAGQLGDELHAAGYRTAVIGNSDRPDYPSRPGSIVLMDSNGIVDHGFIDNSAVILNHRQALPAQSNYTQMLNAYQRLKTNEVVLFEFGDLSRLEAMYSLFGKTRYQQERSLILGQIDNCIGKITSNLPAQSCIYMISPSPSRNSFVPSALMTPLIIVKPGFAGTLTSHSTRHEGVVLSINLKNSILNCLDQHRPESIFATANPDSYQVLKKLNQREVFSYVNQSWLLTIIIGLSFLILLLAIVQVIRRRVGLVSSLMLLFSLALPLSLLLIGFFDVFERKQFILLFLAINTGVAILSGLLGKFFKISPLLPVLATTIIIIAVDLLFNNTLLSNSIMSYRVISGARYYGLGNEYMGVLIGAGISLATLIRNRKERMGQHFTAILFIAITFLIAYPRFGIDVGGAITACIGLGYTYFIFKPHSTKISLKRIFFLFLSAIALVTAMVIIDLKQPAELQSHLGKSISLIHSGGLNEVFHIILRKIHMQLRVMSYSGLGWILLLGMGAALSFMLKPKYYILQLKNQAPIIYKGLLGLLLSAIVAILFNDSGITSAANLFLYFLVMLFSTWKLNVAAIQKH
ncbi:MAG: O-antigen ligase [Syntrophomonadaceae bacterium]|nr:O-antigen ligase [Syntrophomonadaceae bacterium]